MAAIKSSGDGTRSPAPLSPSICLPSCPSRCCPPCPIVSPRRLPPSRICAGTRPVSMVGGGRRAVGLPATRLTIFLRGAHNLRPGPLWFPGRTLSLSLCRIYRPTHRRFITSSLTRRNFSTRARYLIFLSRVTPLVLTRAWNFFPPRSLPPVLSVCPLWYVEAVIR